MFPLAFKGIKTAVWNYFNFPWLKIEFPDFSLTLKNYFPDHFVTCGNPDFCDFLGKKKKSAYTNKTTNENILLQPCLSQLPQV